MYTKPKKTGNPSVTIIMPSLNVAKYIEECIESALCQTLAETEILCIDAGSTDGTWEILTGYAQNPKYESKIRLIHSDIKSYGYQVNMGIREARGDYVAVLETDDYIHPDMYKTLYELAYANNLDYIKADYDSFYEFDNGSRHFDREKLWDENDSRACYDKVICPQHHTYLYWADYYLWKGIYKKEFLTENDIRLNESKGAAYQDIGFSQLVHACAKRAYYIGDSFYRYRTDRPGASWNSLRGLEYSKQEFQRLLETELKDKIVSDEGIFTHMARSFTGEYRRTLISTGYDIQSEYLQPYYTWFHEILEEALNANRLPIDDMFEFIKIRFELLMRSPQEFAHYIEQSERENVQRRERLTELVEENPIYVFGAGKLGNFVTRTLLEMNLDVRMVCDNDSSKWGTIVYDIPVEAPDTCVSACKETRGVMLIVNKKYSEEIRQQLLAMGITEHQIKKYEPLN